MQRWYITFHGGEGRDEWNNIHAYDLNGAPFGKMLDVHTLPKGLELRELRGMEFGPDGNLYVANAYQGASQVLRFTGKVGKNKQHRFLDVFVQKGKANPGLDHPFAVTFGPDGHLFVPSQDTNLIGRYAGPAGTTTPPGSPMPIPPALDQTGANDLPPGTFVPSKLHAHHGLKAVRDTRFAGDGTLFVADRDDNSVKTFHGTSGAPIREFRHPELTSPIHVLIVDDSHVLVGSRDANAIFRIDTRDGGIRTLVASNAGGLKGPAGMAIGPDGQLYVCSRESREILRYDLKTGTPDVKPFIAKLKDLPEFISLVDTAA